MSFCLCLLALVNVPSTFQAFMNQVLKSYLSKFALVFFDEILICSGDEKSHKEHLKMVLQVWIDHELFVNKKKRSFG